MIVVLGSVVFRSSVDGTGRAAGAAAEIAAAAAAAGGAVELLAKVGEDGAGEELLIALARAGVGHLAVLRDPARPTALAREAGPALAADEPADDAGLAPAILAEPGFDGPHPGPDVGLPVDPADLSLGLRYLREYRVVVAVEPLPEGGAAVVADAASFADAALVVVAVPGAVLPEAYTAATVLEAPPEDPDGAFTALVGRFAAALDRGEPAGEALRAAAAAGGWEPAGT